MKITRARLYRYRLPLREPLRLRDQVLKHREGLLLSLEDDRGHQAWGEAAPLPGFSRERLKDAATSLEDALEVLVASPLGSAAEEWRRLLTGPLPPSVCCALDMALLRLAAAAQGQPLHTFLRADAPAEVPIATLLTNEATSFAAHSASLKIKVGGRPIPEEIARIRHIAAQQRPGVRLRLDANRAWTYDEALTFAEAAAELPVEYLEEPLRDWRTLTAFAKDCVCPIALDETLLDIQEDDPVLGVAAALIWKPTLTTKSPHEMVQWAAQRTRPVPLILSGAYESGVAIAAFAAYAAAWSPPGAAAGLDTYSRLERDLLDPPLSMTDGTLTLSPSPLPLPVCQDRLRLLRDIG